MLFWKSNRQKLIDNARGAIHMANKVIDYRKDLLSGEVVEDIRRAADSLHALIKDKATADRSIEQGIRRVDAKISPHGGKIYPVTFWSENIEMLLVAAILAIGIRSFFFQPFKIPTNSMYPTYAGMIPHVYAVGEERPSLPARAFRFITQGAVNHDIKAPVSGEVLIPLNSSNDRSGIVFYEPHQGRKWFGLLPSVQRRYAVLVGDQPAVVDLPFDFNLDSVVLKTYFGEEENLQQVVQKAQAQGRLRSTRLGPAIATGVRVQPGESVLDFDILTGDMLFVDRISYHFVQPKIGDPFVFRTREIPGLRGMDGSPDDKYYIKRLVGMAGDELEIIDHALIRNGMPIEGADAFDRNARREGEYPGYEARWRLAEGLTETIPDGHYYAMGDNSPDSYDSRGWGMPQLSRRSDFFSDVDVVNFVPEKEVVGKAIFIFYPFSSRWGPAE